MKMPDIDMNDDLKKIAKLFVFLDSNEPGLCTNIFNIIGEEKSKKLIYAMTQVGEIQKDEIDTIIHDFHSMAIDKNIIFGGDEFSSKILRDSFGVETPEEFFKQKRGFFTFLEDVSDDDLVEFLKLETYQFRAFILRFLTGQRVSSLLVKFPLKEAAVMSSMLISTKPIHPHILSLISKKLESELLGEKDITRKGKKSVYMLMSEGLEMMHSNSRDQIMSFLEEKIKKMQKKLKSICSHLKILYYYLI